MRLVSVTSNVMSYCAPWTHLLADGVAQTRQLHDAIQATTILLDRIHETGRARGPSRRRPQSPTASCPCATSGGGNLSNHPLASLSGGARLLRDSRLSFSSIISANDSPQDLSQTSVSASSGNLSTWKHSSKRALESISMALAACHETEAQHAHNVQHAFRLNRVLGLLCERIIVQHLQRELGQRARDHRGQEGVTLEQHFARSATARWPRSGMSRLETRKYHPLKKQPVARLPHCSSPLLRLLLPPSFLPRVARNPSS